MNSEDALRQTLCDVGKLMYDKGLITGTEGNLSCLLSGNRLLISPAGVCKGMMNPEQIVVMNLEGATLSSNLEPSTEFAVHLAAYRTNEKIFAVVHAHPNYATAFSFVGEHIYAPNFPEFTATFGQIPLVPFAQPGSSELAKNVEAYIQIHHTCLLEKHGLLSTGADLWQAFYRIEMAEQCCKTLYLAEQLVATRSLEDFGLDDDLDYDDDLERKIPQAPIPVPRRRRDN